MSTETNHNLFFHNGHQWHVPTLAAGDRLDRDEFLRRYNALPDFNQAELIEGVVYMASPVSAKQHGEVHSMMMTMLGFYSIYTRPCVCGDNSTINLDSKNAPQPDCYLRLETEFGGQTKIEDGMIVGAPELIAEISASSVSYDLHDKKSAYERNGVKEYIVWRVDDRKIDWFVLEEGSYKLLNQDKNGVYKSNVFPGLWIDSALLIAGKFAEALKVLNEGIHSQDHRDFVASLTNP
jgi:Uma2 family endonuclease